MYGNERNRIGILIVFRHGPVKLDVLEELDETLPRKRIEARRVHQFLHVRHPLGAGNLVLPAVIGDKTGSVDELVHKDGKTDGALFGLLRG